MGSRGPVVFAVLFLVLPLLGILAAAFVAGTAGVGLTMASLGLLLVGFTLGLFLVE